MFFVQLYSLKEKLDKYGVDQGKLSHDFVIFIVQEWIQLRIILDVSMNLCAYTIFHSDVEFWCLPLIYEYISQVIAIVYSNELFSNFSLLSAKKKISTM